MMQQSNPTRTFDIEMEGEGLRAMSSQMMALLSGKLPSNLTPLVFKEEDSYMVPFPSGTKTYYIICKDTTVSDRCYVRCYLESNRLTRIKHGYSEQELIDYHTSPDSDTLDDIKVLAAW